MFEEFYGGVGVVSSDPLRDGREPLDARTPADSSWLQLLEFAASVMGL